VISSSISEADPTFFKDNEMKLNDRELNEMVGAMQASGSFDLQPPADWDDLDEATTNESIEIGVEDNIGDNELYEDDGQPTEYEEWQDLYGGDDSIYEHDCDCMFDY